MTDLEKINLIALSIYERTEEPIRVSLSDIVGKEEAIELQLSKKEITL